MAHWIEFIATIFGTVLASNGLWAWLSIRNEKKDHKTQMLVGLGHDRIMALGMKYLERGDWITESELENLVDCLFKPYEALGGNGSAKKVVDDCKELRVVKEPLVEEDK